MKLLFLLISLTISQILTAQDESKILAQAGKYSITVQEFKERWDMSPQPGRSMSGSLEPDKLELLQTMVAEKLLAQYAEESGVDTTYIFRQMMKSLEQTYIRDELYKTDIISKIKVTDKMINEARMRNRVIHHVNFLFDDDSVRISKLYKQIQRGADFDSLLAKRPEKDEQTKTLSVSYGTLEADAENIIYSLKQNEISKPVRSTNGFFIFKLVWTESKNISPKSEDIETKIKDMVYIREMDKYYLQFMRTFFKDRPVATDGKLFQLVSDNLVRLILDTKSQNIAGDIGLTDQDLFQLESMLGSAELSKPFIKMKDNSISLREFLYDLQFEGFSVKKADEKIIRETFYSRTKLKARDAVITVEAYKRNYQQLDHIRKILEIKKAAFLSERMKGRAGSKIQVYDDEVSEYYKKQYAVIADTILINLKEVYVSQFESVKDILEKINQGDSFDKIAEAYDENPNNRKRKHETGFVYPSTLGELGITVSKLKLFETYGPVSFGPFYRIVQLIGREKSKGQTPKTVEPFEEVSGELKNRIWKNKYDEVLGKTIAGLAEKYYTTMNENELKSVNVNAVNMVTYQQMGFGGKILAVPYSAPTTSWVKYRRNNQSQTP